LSVQPRKRIRMPDRRDGREAAEPAHAQVEPFADGRAHALTSRARAVIRLAPPIRRIPMRAEQQRNVKLRFSLAYLKCHLHDRKETLDPLRVLVACSIEAQTVEPGRKSILAGKQLRTATVSIRARRT